MGLCDCENICELIYGTFSEEQGLFGAQLVSKMSAPSNK